jgi:hypothetical protein
LGLNCKGLFFGGVLVEACAVVAELSCIQLCCAELAGAAAWAVELDCAELAGAAAWAKLAVELEGAELTAELAFGFALLFLGRRICGCGWGCGWADPEDRLMTEPPEPTEPPEDEDSHDSALRFRAPPGESPEPCMAARHETYNVYMVQLRM